MSLGLTFEVNSSGVVSTNFKGNDNLQGYTGILHGGIVSSLMDSVMTNCLAMSGIEGVTADLRVRFLESIPCDAPLIIKAWITEAKHVLYYLKSEIYYENKLMARAKATFVKR